MNCPNCKEKNDDPLMLKDGGTKICSYCQSPFYILNGTIIAGYYQRVKDIVDKNRPCPECNKIDNVIIDDYLLCNNCDSAYF